MKTAEEKKAYLKAYYAKKVKEKFGREVGAPGRPKNTPEELWRKVDRRGLDECWPWIGSINGGYGRTEINGKAYYAHRVIYDLANPGKIELEGPTYPNDTTFILHQCDNKICCNPGHMKLGTHAENMKEKADRGLSAKFSGGRSKRCLLTMDQAREARRLVKSGKTIKELAIMFGMARNTMYELIIGKSYREIE